MDSKFNFYKKSVHSIGLGAMLLCLPFASQAFTCGDTTENPTADLTDWFEKAPGVYKKGDDWWVIFHAKQGAEKVYLDLDNGSGGYTGVRLAKATNLSPSPTTDIWWCKATDSQWPSDPGIPTNGESYYFSVEDEGNWVKYPDPAARSANFEWNKLLNDDRLTASKIYKSSYSWSSESSSWTRPTQDKLNIYQVHPGRFTARNENGSGTLLAFDQLIEEIDNDGNNDYINELGVNAIELLPVSEFSGDKSLGYNPTFYYAIENSYGGADKLKELVDKAHSKGIAVILDIVLNHVGNASNSGNTDDLFAAIDAGTYLDGETIWGKMPNFDNMVVRSFFMQNIMYLVEEFKIDGFRFDQTMVMHNCLYDVNNVSKAFPYDETTNPDGLGILLSTADGCNGGDGWYLMRDIYAAVQDYNTTNSTDIWLTAEELPDDWSITDDDDHSEHGGYYHGPYDSQWTDNFHDNFKRILTGESGYTLDNLKYDSNDASKGAFMSFGDGWQDATIYTASHDEVQYSDGNESPERGRISSIGLNGKGYEMEMTAMAGTLMMRGTPLIFMGQEYGELTPFYHDKVTNVTCNDIWKEADATSCPQGESVDKYRIVKKDNGSTSFEDGLSSGQNSILNWYKTLTGIRNADATDIATGDISVTHSHNDNGIFAFTRNNGEYLVVMNFKSTAWDYYDVGVSGSYRELLNSSWSAYNVGGVTEKTRGTQAQNISDVHIPAYGVVILKKDITVPFECNNANSNDEVYVVGDKAVIGSWDSNEGVLLTNFNNGTWSGDVHGLPVNQTVQWKCYEKTTDTWESGSNHSFTTPSSGTMSQTQEGGF